MADPRVVEKAIRHLQSKGALSGAKPPAPAPIQVGQTECAKRGKALGSVTCPTCSGRVELKVFACPEFGSCTVTKPHADVKGCCATCPKRRTANPVQFDERNLWPGVPGKRFNASILEWFGHYLICFRNGWKGSDLYVGVLDKNFEPVGEPTKLEIRHPEAGYGREDPRLFWHRGQVHVAFAGVVGGDRIRHTSVLIARLGPGFSVAEVFCPHYEDRNLWEKNISMWSHGDVIYGVYGIRPHRVVKVEDGKMHLVYDEPFDIPWTGGEWRGGASPVCVGGENFHWCHDRITADGLLTYRTLLYSFELNPPFRPLRYCPQPIMTADKKTKPTDQYCACVFSTGAVFENGKWYVSSGEHDRWTRIDEFDHAELVDRMLPIKHAR